MNYNEIELLDYLSKFSIEFGILDDTSSQKVIVNILNTDGTTTEMAMTVGDLMYFTEYGTAIIPGRFILEKILPQIERLLDREISLIVDGIFQKQISTDYIKNQIGIICLKIKDKVKNYMKSYTKNLNQLGDIINEGEDENKYLYSLEKLSEYIKCEPKFKN